MKQRKEVIKYIQERIKELIELAIKKYDENPELARRYVKIALEYRNKNRVRIPKEIKNKFCKKCLTPWIPGKTVRVRIVPNRYVVYTCLVCNYKKRIPLQKL